MWRRKGFTGLKRETVRGTPEVTVTLAVDNATEGTLNGSRAESRTGQ